MTEQLPPGTKLPLVCTYRDMVEGNGYVARVETRGRMLAVVDADGELWLHAVQPSGWAETGCSIAEAHAVFRQSYTAILYDLAEDAANFEEFRRLAEELSQDASALTESWKDAVADMKTEWADKLNLQIEPAGQMPYVRVQQIQHTSPRKNELGPALPAVVSKRAA